MTEPLLEFLPLARYWPERDSAMTVFRYALVRGPCRGKRVLEIGAAAGEGTALLADAAEIVALDHQDVWSGGPGSRLPNARFVQRDALDLPAEWAGRFDVVLALELIEHLDDPAALQQAVFRVLAEGGTFIFSTPNFDLYSRACGDDRTPLYRRHVREYRAAELNAVALDLWDSRQLCGVSQLSFPGDPLSGNGFVMLHDSAAYELTLGPQYPDYGLRRVGAVVPPLPLECCQSFLVMLGKQQADAPCSAKRLGLDNPAAELNLTAGEAALRACRVILQRKNEQIGHFEQIVADRQQQIVNLQGKMKLHALCDEYCGDRQEQIVKLQSKASDLENMVAERDRQRQGLDNHIRNLGMVVAQRDQQIRSLQRHAGSLEGIVADRETRLADTQAIVEALTTRLESLEKRLPIRMARWVRSGCHGWLAQQCRPTARNAAAAGNALSRSTVSIMQKAGTAGQASSGAQTQPSQAVPPGADG
ncbi:MAG: methyltransferase domain-containing protein [Thermoguttaceae bacterium]